MPSATATTVTSNAGTSHDRSALANDGDAADDRGVLAGSARIATAPPTSASTGAACRSAHRAAADW